MTAPSLLINSRIDLAPDSTASTIDGYARTIARRHVVANGASASLFPRTSSGPLVVNSATDNATAVIVLSNLAATILSDPDGIFTTRPGARYRINVFRDNTYWRLENQRGVERALHVHLLE